MTLVLVFKFACPSRHVSKKERGSFLGYFFSSKPLGATQCVQIMRDKNRDEGDGKVCHALYRHGGRSKDFGGRPIVVNIFESATKFEKNHPLRFDVYLVNVN